MLLPNEGCRGRPNSTLFGMKSTVEEIRARFDADVDRFSDLDAGQSATVDAPLVLELIARAAVASTPHATSLLDVGCGAGNYALKLQQLLPLTRIDLLDLSEPMLSRAVERISAVSGARLRTLRGDVRELPLEPESYDVVVAAATLHHLRGEEEWTAVFDRLFAALRPGGSLWISDLVEHSDPAIHQLMWSRYGEYLSALGGTEYRDRVFAYIDREDSPRPLMFQIDLLRSAGFQDIDILHKNGVFAAFGGVKRRTGLA